MARSAERFAGVAALAVAPMAARNLAVGLSRVPTRFLVEARRTAAAIAAVACAASVASMARADLPLGLGFRPDAFPVRAADYLEAIGFDGRLYNTFDSGGYLEWTLEPKGVS